MKNLGYMVTLWEDLGKSCPDCDGHIVTNSLKELNRIYKNGVQGSTITQAEIFRFSELEKILDENQQKFSRFKGDLPIINDLTQSELDTLYKKQKKQLVNIFPREILQKKILPMYSKKN